MTLAVVLGSTAWAGLALSTEHPGWAAVTCQGAGPQPGAGTTGVPWQQQRFGLDRLAGIADGDNQLIAVLDSGVDSRHPQLSEAVTAGFDALDATGDGRTDCVGHGTAVASLIAARPAAGAEFRGIAPKARILPVRVSERQELNGTADGRSVDLPGLAAAVRQAVDRRATVINMSLVAYGTDDPALRSAIQYAVGRDVLVVAAVGNLHDRGDPVPYPAAYPGVLGVGAIDQEGHRVSASQVGDWVDLTAPGAGVLAAAPVRGFAERDGTSFATPQVAAAAALVRQYHPGLSAAQVAARLTATADPAPGGAREYGAGVVNPYRAVTARLEASARPLAGLPPPSTTSGPDEIAGRWRPALVVAGCGVLLAIVIVLVASALPRGIRRRWRVGTRPQRIPDPARPTPGPALLRPGGPAAEPGRELDRV